MQGWATDKQQFLAAPTGVPLHTIRWKGHPRIPTSCLCHWLTSPGACTELKVKFSTGPCSVIRFTAETVSSKIPKVHGYPTITPLGACWDFPLQNHGHLYEVAFPLPHIAINMEFLTSCHYKSLHSSKKAFNKIVEVVWQFLPIFEVRY